MNLRLIWATAVLEHPNFSTPEGIQNFANAVHVYLPQYSVDEIMEMDTGLLKDLLTKRAAEIAAQAQREGIGLSSTDAVAAFEKIILGDDEKKDESHD